MNAALRCMSVHARDAAHGPRAHPVGDVQDRGASVAGVHIGAAEIAMVETAGGHMGGEIASADDLLASLCRAMTAAALPDCPACSALLPVLRAHLREGAASRLALGGATVSGRR